jgi:lycopene cyclase domain-containing protein
MTYTQLALAGAAAAVLVDLAVLRTGLLRRRIYWTAYAIVLAFQLLANGLLTARHVVTYRPDTILGPRIGWAPVEDLLYGFALVTLTLSLWVRLGRRRVRGGGGAGAAGAAGPAPGGRPG